MSRIAERFQALRARNEKALVLFVTAGDPSLEDLPDILRTLEKAGADVLEVGIPFSDPIADGPTIQASSQRALERGVTPRSVLETLAGVEVETPLVLMGYMNPLLRMGLSEFARAARRSGISGTIVSDLTPDEADDWIAASRAEGLDNIFLAAPTSTDARLDAICARSSGFVYAVSRTGVTGAENAVPDHVRELVSRIQRRTSLPVCVGFGISRHEQVRRVCEVADGAVIGSWLVELLARDWRGGAGRERVAAEVAALKSATKERYFDSAAN